MKDFADVDQSFDDVAETSLLEGEWDDLGHDAHQQLCSPIIRASVWLGQLKYNWPEPGGVFDGATPSEQEERPRPDSPHPPKHIGIDLALTETSGLFVYGLSCIPLGATPRLVRVDLFRFGFVHPDKGSPRESVKCSM
jgi:hypothetical protein